MQNNYGNPNTITFVLPLGLYTPAYNYTPNASANDAVYKQDAVWYAAHADRWWVIRKVAGSEFDELNAAVGYQGGILFPPQLWCLVTRHPRLGHRVIPVWRGSLPLSVDLSGYLTADSDDLIGHYLDTMAKTGGINQAEWLEWDAKWNDAKRIYNAEQASGNQRGQVH